MMCEDGLTSLGQFLRMGHSLCLTAGKGEQDGFHQSMLVPKALGSEGGWWELVGP